MKNNYHFGVVGLGQLGSALATDLAIKAEQNVLGFDPYVNVERAQLLVQKGITVIENVEALNDVDYVLIAVPHSHSMEAVKTVVPAMKSDAVLIDLTSADAASKLRLAEVAEAAGKEYMDGAVLGPAADGIRVPIILAGARADEVADALSSVGVNARAVGGQIGQASSIKVVRSVLAKGLEALYVEGLLSARRLGIQDVVFDSFCAMLDTRNAADMAALLVTTHAMHAQRRCEEVMMSVDTLASTGIPLHMSKATISVFTDTIKSLRKNSASAQIKTLDQALADLDRIREH
ncbi:NAD(P)-dependent oxidoreductase [Alcaligenaceae bacterium]|nr:NAD(P)-dependent oxidoreductase [Alcaligenaceae bacterium]